MSVIMLLPNEFLAISESLKNSDNGFWSLELYNFLYNIDQLILDMIYINAIAYKDRYPHDGLQVQYIIDDPSKYLELAYTKESKDNASGFSMRCSKDKNILSAALCYYIYQIEGIYTFEDCSTKDKQEKIIKILESNLISFLRNEFLFKSGYYYGVDCGKESKNKRIVKYSFISYKTRYDSCGNTQKLIVIFLDNKVVALSTSSNNDIYRIFGDVKLLSGSAHFENMPITKKGIKEMIKYYCQDKTVKLYT